MENAAIEFEMPTRINLRAATTPEYTAWWKLVVKEIYATDGGVSALIRKFTGRSDRYTPNWPRIAGLRNSDSSESNQDADEDFDDSDDNDEPDNVEVNEGSDVNVQESSHSSANENSDLKEADSDSERTQTQYQASSLNSDTQSDKNR